ncbi:hypothetical protein CLU95_0312 [Variovorax sp. 54]|nr:hypothetical protein CLU95_0312 [Variovorax sp. 54]
MRRTDSMRCAAALRCPLVWAFAVAFVRRTGRFFHALRGIVFLATSLLMGVQAMAAEVCVAMRGTYAGVVVTMEGQCEALSTVYGTTYLWLGFHDSAEACTFNFSVPVSNPSVRVYASNCTIPSCEKVAVSVDGNHYPFTAAEVTTPAPDGGGSQAQALGRYKSMRTATFREENSSPRKVAGPLHGPLFRDHLCLPSSSRTRQSAASQMGRGIRCASPHQNSGWRSRKKPARPAGSRASPQAIR